MKITKVKLGEQGLKGMSVTFVRNDEKDGLTWNNEYTVQYKYPVQGVLLKAFEALAVHLGNICGLEVAQKGIDKLSNGYDNISVVGVSVKSGGIVLTGKVEASTGKTYAVNTPFTIIEDAYEGFGKMEEQVERLLDLVEEYVEGGYKINKEQYVLDLHAGDENFDTDVYAKLSTAEKESMFIKELEDKGYIVLQQEAA